MQRSLIVLLLGITIGLIAASLDWRGTQQRSKFLFDQNVKCQQVARQYETENRAAVVKVTYSPSRSSCVAEVTRPPQKRQH
jgi:ribosomal protein L2